MEFFVQVMIGIIVLIIGYYLGGFLKNFASDEIKQGQTWFKFFICFSLIGGVITAALKINYLFFTLLLMAIVTSRSLEKNKKRKKN